MAELPLISFKQYYEDLPEHLVTTFKAFKPEEQEKLRAMIKACEEQAELAIRAKMGKSVIFKLDQNYQLDTAKNWIAFDLPAGRVIAPLTDQLLELISKANGSTYIKAKLSGLKPARRKVIAEADKLQFFKADYDLKTAEELLKEHRAIDLLMLSLGYKPTAEAIAVTLPRLLTLFKYYDRNKIAGVHTVSFQQAGTGKSSTFCMLESLANAYYCEEIPTVAKLIGDARLGSFGIVKRADIIAIDEFDKVTSDFKDRFELIFPILLTGMEQGIYRREVSSKKELSIKKAISYCFMGNSSNKDLSSYGIAEKLSAVEMLETILKTVFPSSNVPAFMDRLIYVEFLKESYQILRDINTNSEGLTQVLEPRVARGIIKLLREKLLRNFKLGEVDSRTERAIQVLTAILKLLSLEELAEDQGTIEELVRGELTFWDCLVNNSSNSEDSDSGYSIGELLDFKPSEEILIELMENEDNKLKLTGELRVEGDKAIIEAKPSDNGDKVKIRAKQDIPAFQAIDNKVYELKAGEIAEIPKLNAEVLIKHGVAEEVKEEAVISDELREKLEVVRWLANPTVVEHEQ